jgi:hypothetical protein
MKDLYAAAGGTQTVVETAVSSTVSKELLPPANGRRFQGYFVACV